MEDFMRYNPTRYVLPGNHTQSADVQNPRNTMDEHSGTTHKGAASHATAGL
jgi:hypothetical protein